MFNEFPINLNSFLEIQSTKITLILKREYHLISHSSDLLLDQIHNEKEELKEQSYGEICQNIDESHKTRKSHKKFCSCPSFSQFSNLGLKKNQSMGYTNKKPFFNSKKGNNNEIFMLLNSITVRSEDILKQKLMNYIENEVKCAEIAESLIRRCLNSFSVNEIRNINKVNKYLCQKSKEKFAVIFNEKVKNLIEEEAIELKGKTLNMKNVLNFLSDVICEKVMKKREINEIIMRLLLKIIELLLEAKEDQDKLLKIHEKAKFLVILVKASFRKALNEEILERNALEIMRKLNDLRKNNDFLEKERGKTLEICEKYISVFSSQFAELSDD